MDERNRTFVLLAVFLAVAAAALVVRLRGPGMAGEAPIPLGPVTIKQRDTTGVLAAIRASENIPDPFERCLRTPAPTGFVWTAELVEAFCSDRFAPRLRKSEVLAMIADRDYEKLDRRYDALLEAFRARKISEAMLVAAFEPFEDTSVQMRRNIDEWRANRAGSVHAVVATGAQHLAAAWEARGHRYARELSETEISRMKASVGLAALALDRALVLDPGHYIAAVKRLSAAHLGGEELRYDELARNALAIYPEGSHLRWYLWANSLPEWGGSREALAAIADEAASHEDANPRLRAFRGALSAHDGDALYRERKWSEALAKYEEALAFAPVESRFDAVSYVALQTKDYLRTIEFASQALRFNPKDRSARTRRAGALPHVGELDWAYEDLEILLRDDPNDPAVLRSYVWLLKQNGQWAAVESRLKQLRTIDPEDLWTLRQLADMYLYRQRRFDEASEIIGDMMARWPNDGAVRLLRLDLIQNTGKGDMHAAAREFIRYADPSDSEQRQAIPKVQAWLDEH